MKEFDTAKGAFILVVVIIITQMIVSLAVTFFCIFGVVEKIFEVGGCKDATERMMELFQMSFTAAIAFAGGRMSAPPPSQPKFSKEEN